jgi:hypothetical protein
MAIATTPSPPQVTGETKTDSDDQNRESCNQQRDTSTTTTDTSTHTIEFTVKFNLEKIFDGVSRENNTFSFFWYYEGSSNESSDSSLFYSQSRYHQQREPQQEEQVYTLPVGTYTTTTVFDPSSSLSQQVQDRTSKTEGYVLKNCSASLDLEYPSQQYDSLFSFSLVYYGDIGHYIVPFVATVKFGFNHNDFQPQPGGIGKRTLHFDMILIWNNVRSIQPASLEDICSIVNDPDNSYSIPSDMCPSDNSGYIGNTTDARHYIAMKDAICDWSSSFYDRTAQNIQLNNCILNGFDNGDNEPSGNILLGIDLDTDNLNVPTGQYIWIEIVRVYPEICYYNKAVDLASANFTGSILTPTEDQRLSSIIG